MPIPKKKQGEQQKNFMMRCVPELMKYHKKDQAIAMCYDAFKGSVELESYNDYPQGASNNAKRAIAFKEKNGSKCGTQVGWVRARQLADKKNITRDTIARMASFERHRQNSKKELGDGCGRLMWLAWGGDEGIEWAQRKLKQIDK